MRICFIQATWHKEIVDQLKDAFVAEVESLSGRAAEIEFVEVAGSLELPLQAKLFAKSGRFDAIIVAGLIVDGGIYRHEFVVPRVPGQPSGHTHPFALARSPHSGRASTAQRRQRPV